MNKRDRQLRAVLEKRRVAERGPQRAVAALESTRLQIERKINAASTSLGAIREDLREALEPTPTPGTLRFEEVRAQAGASLHARLSLQTLAIELAGVHQRLTRAREELRRAAASRQAVELLIARRRAQAAHLRERREGDDLDEISTARASRPDVSAMEAPR